MGDPLLREMGLLPPFVMSNPIAWPQPWYIRLLFPALRHKKMRRKMGNDLWLGQRSAIKVEVMNASSKIGILVAVQGLQCLPEPVWLRPLQSLQPDGRIPAHWMLQVVLVAGYGGALYKRSRYLWKSSEGRHFERCYRFCQFCSKTSIILNFLLFSAVALPKLCKVAEFVSTSVFNCQLNLATDRISVLAQLAFEKLLPVTTVLNRLPRWFHLWTIPLLYCRNAGIPHGRLNIFYPASMVLEVGISAMSYSSGYFWTILPVLHLTEVFNSLICLWAEKEED